jgi:hypothetical protein
MSRLGFFLLPSAFLNRLWPFFFVVVSPLMLYAPFLLGRQVLYWGTPLLQFYPWRKLAFDMLLSGQWPLWNPYLGNGAPLLANLQSAVFYPPNWLGLALPLEYAFSWLVVLHWVWAGAGMVALARALGFRPLGQAVAGLAFGLSQYLVARAWFFSINAAVAWVPWIIWAAEHCLRPVAWGERRATPACCRRASPFSCWRATPRPAGTPCCCWRPGFYGGRWARGASSRRGRFCRLSFCSCRWPAPFYSRRFSFCPRLSF